MQSTKTAAYAAIIAFAIVVVVSSHAQAQEPKAEHRLQVSKIDFFAAFQADFKVLGHYKPVSWKSRWSYGIEGDLANGDNHAIEGSFNWVLVDMTEEGVEISIPIGLTWNRDFDEESGRVLRPNPPGGNRLVVVRSKARSKARSGMEIHVGIDVLILDSIVVGFKATGSTFNKSPSSYFHVGLVHTF